MDTEGINSTTTIENNSDIPISVTVATELEPVTADGMLRRTAGGFCVMFSSGNVEYFLTHSQEKTVLRTVGEQSYEIVLGASPTHTTILTPFGSIGLTVEPKTRTVTEHENGLDISLKYDLVSEDTGSISRAVEVTVRYKGKL